MTMAFDPEENYRQTRKLLGYIPRKDALPKVYAELGFKCGLEIHQQLMTDKKLFCRCPSGQYQKADEFDAEVIRHMRPTLSEMGEYDGTALMERKTRKNIVYRIKKESACTYEIDDTPPFSINREALNHAIEIALLLEMNVVGELHITRKQYLDGSIPTGFQRTAIVGIEGAIPLTGRTVRMIQISIEEDACREVSDVGHWRVYRTDRLGMPLIESVTYPDMLTPDESAEAGDYLRYLARSSGRVRTGIGAARQDVNVSIAGGTRVEIKGVAHIKWIPELTHNEAFRQKALLEIRTLLNKRIPDQENWSISVMGLDYDAIASGYAPLKEARFKKLRLVGINLPGFRSVLSFFTQPGKVFADEISDRLKVIACLEKPNLIHSEQFNPVVANAEFDSVQALFGAGINDAQIITWGSSEDVETAIETIEERCRIAFVGVPNETRKSLSDGTTIFERVLPGPDRMYPDTDSAPIPIPQNQIESARKQLPVDVRQRFEQLRRWKVPEDCIHYLLRRNLMPLVDRILGDFEYNPTFICNLLGHTLKHLDRSLSCGNGLDANRIYQIFRYVAERNLHEEIVKAMLPLICRNPSLGFDRALQDTGYSSCSREEILAAIPQLTGEFEFNGRGDGTEAKTRWIMGRLHKQAIGNLPLSELRAYVEKEAVHV
jgi:glutamyl-tRNA(Gln) amidotransferase subunit E